MANIAVIGSRDMVGMFELLGLEVFDVEKADEAKRVLDKIIEKEKIKVVFVMESLACNMRDIMREVESLDTITVIPLPDRKSEVSLLDDELRRLSKEAVGMEI